MLRSPLLLTLLLGLSLSSGPAAQSAAGAGEPALTTRDYLDIEQLVYKYGWALDSGENNGFAYADLYAPDGTFTGTNQGPSGRTYQGRDNLAALARGAKRGPLNVGHLAANVIVTPTADGAAGRVYVGIFDPGALGKSPGAGHGGFYDDLYVKTPQGWRFKKRTYYEGKWGTPNVQTPPPMPGVRAIKEARPAATPAAKGRRLSDQDIVELQQLVARSPYGIDMNADDGASFAAGFTSDGTFACVLPHTGTARPTGVPSGCVPGSGKLTTAVKPIAQGRQALAKLATSEEPHGKNFARHWVFNHVIEPGGTGATGKAYVALIDLAPGLQAQGHSIFLMGRYDDEYVKTSQGWRIKNRVLTVTSTRELGAGSNAGTK
jgi:hypothetical protein